MFYVTRSLTLSRTVGAALLAALLARPAAALLTTPTVHLFTGTPTLNPDSVPAAFTEPTFHGYAAVVISALLGPVNLDSNTIGVHQEVDFLATTGGAISDNVTGYYITSGDGTVFYGGETFPTAFGFAIPGDFLSLDVVFPLPLLLDVPQ